MTTFLFIILVVYPGVKTGIKLSIWIKYLSHLENNLTSEIGNRFMHFRNEVLRLSQSEMARRLSVKQSAVRNWEIGRNQPNGLLLWKLVKLFRLNPEWLFDGVGSPLLNETNGLDNIQTKSAGVDISAHCVTIELPRIRILAQNLKHIEADLEYVLEMIHSLNERANPKKTELD